VADRRDLLRRRTGLVDSSGSSPVTAAVGLVLLLGFLLLSSQALVHLHASSVVGAIAFDAARTASADGAGCQDAIARASERLSDLPDLAVDCQDDGSMTRVAVRVASPARAIGGVLGLRQVERAVAMRSERLR
jgi:hypothetical protein